MGQLRVCVLGGGVVGVTTALELLAALPSAQLTVMAAQFHDTTSHGAAGIFRPGTSFSGPTEEITRRWLADSYRFYAELADSSEDCGVVRTSGYIFSSTSPELVQNELLEGLVPVYRRATAEELATICPGDWKFGAYFETLLTECRKFLPWALDRVVRAGGKLVEQRVESLPELEGCYDAVVNCTGLGARRLVRDRKLVPIRGQVVKVRAPWIKQFYYADYDTYVIPQSEGVVTLGGSRHYDSHHTEPCPHDLAAIKERCERLVPSLVRAEVLHSWAGLRPHRDTVRVQLQTTGTLKVVHNYGHGGYGVTTAPGTAKHAVQLVRDALMCNSKL